MNSARFSLALVGLVLFAPAVTAATGTVVLDPGNTILDFHPANATLNQEQRLGVLTVTIQTPEPVTAILLIQDESNATHALTVETLSRFNAAPALAALSERLAALEAEVAKLNDTALLSELDALKADVQAAKENSRNAWSEAANINVPSLAPLSQRIEAQEANSAALAGTQTTILVQNWIILGVVAAFLAWQAWQRWTNSEPRQDDEDEADPESFDLEAALKKKEAVQAYLSIHPGAPDADKLKQEWGL